MTVSGQSYRARMPLAEMRDHPENPRRGDDAAVGESIAELGWYGAVIVQKSSGYTLAGHTRRRSLAARGAKTAPAIVLDCDDDTARRILLADNRTAELAVWDEPALAAALASVPSLAGTGFSEDDLLNLQARLDPGLPEGFGEVTPGEDDDGSPLIACPACGHEFAPGARTG